MPKKVLIALPPAMLEQIDHVAGVEHRTRSDLIREAMRRYLLEFASRQYHPSEAIAKAKVVPIVAVPEPAPLPVESPVYIKEEPADARNSSFFTTRIQ